jgi:glycine C-acetyltransferase
MRMEELSTNGSQFTREAAKGNREIFPPGLPFVPGKIGRKPVGCWRHEYPVPGSRSRLRPAPPPRMNAFAPDPLAGSWRQYLARPGIDLGAKSAALLAWTDARVRLGGFPYGRRLTGGPGPTAVLRGLDGEKAEGINFSSQDYLGLAAHPEITHAACVAIARYGIHSAGSAALAGSIDLGEELEGLLAEHLGLPCVTLHPSGWAAGYGAIRALVRSRDHVLLDAQVSPGLKEGARAATRRLRRFRHLDLRHVREQLAHIRKTDTANGILVATDSLFSLDATVPDLVALQTLCREYRALLLVDVAHDLGSTGPGGTGQLGLQGLQGGVDLVVGSFAKSLASNGGFIATARRDLREYLRYFSPAGAFSNALSPVQVAVVLAALRVVRSAEGDRRRAGLMGAVNALRAGLAVRDVPALGGAAPSVPIPVGRPAVARLAAKLAAERGVLLNLIEHPLAPSSASRFRAQLMSLHEPSACEAAAGTIAEAIAEAREACPDREAPAPPARAQPWPRVAHPARWRSALSAWPSSFAASSPTRP